MDSSSVVIFLSSDLMFYSQISSAAKAAGLRSMMLKSAGEIAEKAAASDIRWFLVDLFHVKENVAELAQELRRICSSSQILGFGPHVDADALAAARAAGFDDVMPRSKFHHVLPGLFLSDE